VCSEIGKGSQFQVYLPVIVGMATQTVESEISPAGNEELVLIVDDETIVQQATKIALETHHYRTLVASDGVEAIDLYIKHERQIRVAIVDMMMPNIDGLTTLQNLKKRDPQLAMIAVSGLPAKKQQALSAGAKVFLAKPYTAQELLNRLHDLILEASR
jgi:two-component system, cell cycle sensor histidine kinase and response regulator CckA